MGRVMSARHLLTCLLCCAGLSHPVSLGAQPQRNAPSAISAAPDAVIPQPADRRIARHPPAAVLEGETVTFEIASEGVRVLRGADLIALGVPASTAPARIQAWDDTGEVPLLAVGDTGTLKETVFYLVAGPRDAEADADYYPDLATLPRPHRPLTQASQRYVVSWGASQGRRYQELRPEPGIGHATPVRGEQVAMTFGAYFAGPAAEAGNPTYSPQEGYYSGRLIAGTGPQHALTLSPGADKPNDAAWTAITLSAYFDGAGPHRLVLTTGNATLVDTTLDATGYAELTIPQRANWPGGFAPVRVAYRAGSVAYIDRLRFHWEGLAGPQSPSYALPDARSLRLALSGTTDTVFVLNPTRGLAGTMLYAGADSLTNVVWSDEDVIYPGRYGSVPTVGPLTFVAAPAAQPQRADAVAIITPEALLPSARAWAAYRESVSGGSYVVDVVVLEDLVHRYRNGTRDALALRAWLADRQARQTAPIAVVLWGDALYRNPTDAAPPWFVPTFGHKASDALLFDLDGDGIEDVPVGRIPARTNEAGRAFVSKITAYEQVRPAAWQKHALFVSGGQTSTERRLLREDTQAFGAQFASAQLALQPTYIHKTDGPWVDGDVLTTLRSRLADGVSWLTYFGHSALDQWEIITDPPQAFGNEDRYPVVLSLGCYTGDFAGGDASVGLESLAESLVLTPSAGAIVHIGASNLGTIRGSSLLGSAVQRAVGEQPDQPLAMVLRSVKQALYAANPWSASVTRHNHQYGLVGDPLTRLQFAASPWPVLRERDIVITPRVVTEADGALSLTIPMENHGLRPTEDTRLEAIVQWSNPDAGPGLRDTLALTLPPTAYADTARVAVVIPPGRTGEQQIDLRLYMDSLSTDARVQVPIYKASIDVIRPRPDEVHPRDDSLRLWAVLPFRIDPTAAPPGIDVSIRGVAGDVLYTTRVAWPRGDWLALALPPPQRLGVDAGSVTLTLQLDASSAAPTTIPVHLTSGDLPGLGTGGAVTLRMLPEHFVTDGRMFWDQGAWRWKREDVSVTATAERRQTVHVGEFIVNGTSIERLGLGFGLLVINGTSGELRLHDSYVTYASGFADQDAERQRLLADVARIQPGDHVFMRTRHLANRNPSAPIDPTIVTALGELGFGAIDTLTYQDVWVGYVQAGLAPADERVSSAADNADGLQVTWTVPLWETRGEGRGFAAVPHGRWRSATARGDTSASGIDLAVYATDAHPSPRVPIRVDAPLILSEAGGDGGIYADRVQVDLGLQVAVPGADAPGLTAIDLVVDLPVERHLSPQLIHPDDPARSAWTVQPGDTLEATLFVATTADVEMPIPITQTVWNADQDTVWLQRDTLRVRGSDSSRLTFAPLYAPGSYTLSVVLEDIKDLSPTNHRSEARISVAGASVDPTVDISLDGVTLEPWTEPLYNLGDPRIPYVATGAALTIAFTDPNANLGAILAHRQATGIPLIQRDGVHIPYSIEADASDGGRVSVYAPLNLPEASGTHTIDVFLRDAAGKPLDPFPWRTYVRVQTETELSAAYPYPNPMATQTQFMFSLRAASADRVERVDIQLFTMAGKPIRRLSLPRDAPLSVGWNRVWWDGRDADGNPVASGSYIYVVRARGLDGAVTVDEKAMQRGIVTVIR